MGSDIDIKLSGISKPKKRLFRKRGVRSAESKKEFKEKLKIEIKEFKGALKGQLNT